MQACTEAGKQWGQVTGATVNAQVIPFAERATSYASWIVSKDASYDVLYGGVDFISNFGDKLYLPLKDMLGDTGDYVPAALGQLTKGVRCSPHRSSPTCCSSSTTSPTGPQRHCRRRSRERGTTCTGTRPS